MKIVSGSDELAGTLPKSNVIDRAETKPPPCTSRTNTAQALETRTAENAGAKNRLGIQGSRKRESSRNEKSPTGAGDFFRWHRRLRSHFPIPT